MNRRIRNLHFIDAATPSPVESLHSIAVEPSKKFGERKDYVDKLFPSADDPLFREQGFSVEVHLEPSGFRQHAS